MSKRKNENSGSDGTDDSDNDSSSSASDSEFLKLAHKKRNTRTADDVGPNVAPNRSIAGESSAPNRQPGSRSSAENSDSSSSDSSDSDSNSKSDSDDDDDDDDDNDDDEAADDNNISADELKTLAEDNDGDVAILRFAMFRKYAMITCVGMVIYLATFSPYLA